MSRKNIFDLVSTSFHVDHELDRIRRLFIEEKPVFVYSIRTDCSVLRYVDKYGFYQWRNRGRCIDVNDFLSVLGYEELWNSAPSNLQDFLTLIEIVYNFCWIVKNASSKGKVSMTGFKKSILRFWKKR